ncbi:hypothetical protein [Saccharopolyspora gloriosae]|uniref:hypothetical protein n=1 Tax=Saccharopolyspora gloriosae TaxID=455344 RepID=UPI001FB7707B|nr:hypothetical protein [Saccharopolyspora gloriosae]
MSSPRRPGSSSRRRVAGQRSRSGSTGSSTRIGLNRPEDSTEAVEESITEVGPDAETGSAAPAADEASSPAAEEASAAAPDETDQAASTDAELDDSPAESSNGDATGANTTPAAEPNGPVTTGKAGRAKRNGTTHETTPAARQEPVYSYRPDVEPSAGTDPTWSPNDRTEQDSSEADAETTAAGRPGGTKNLIIAMVAATVLLVGLATWFGIEAYGANNGNRALSDQATTSEVNGQITDGIEKIFSYDFADTGKTERAAQDLLTGAAVGEYEQLFITVKEQAPIQKLVVTTTVKASSVTRLEGDRAEVLLFVDQNATRTDVGGEPSVGPAQVVVNAEKQGDKWKISGITQR